MENMAANMAVNGGEAEVKAEVKRRGRPRKVQVVSEGEISTLPVVLGTEESTYSWAKTRLSRDQEVNDFLNSLDTECAFAAKVYFREERFEVFYPVKN